jgi:hypothetical protein
MKRMEHIAEEDLIAYRLHESADEAAIRAHLESCAECAAVSDSIAETLRVFSAGPVPQPDLERNWQRLRGNLSVLTGEKKQRFNWLRSSWMLPAGGFAVAMLLLAALLLGPVRWRVVPQGGSHVANVGGPLTEQPTDPAMANHLDAAERFLTEVNNSSGPLDASTKEQAHSLLLKNAVYVQQARSENDLGEATVLENLGRVLTAVDHEGAGSETARIETEGYRRTAVEAENTHPTLGVRLEMNTSGLLLEIRVLRQNDKIGQ